MTAPAAPASPITAASAADAERVVAVVALVFGADPAARWLYPAPQQCLANWPAFVRAFASGTAYYTAGYGGAALRFSPGEHADDELTALLEASVAPHRRPDVFATFEQMGAYHPHEAHWYLPLIAVEPTRQGRGYGSARLQHALARCDSEDKPAYLESTSHASKALCQRHGFETVATIQVGDAPPIWPMVRQPR